MQGLILVLTPHQNGGHKILTHKISSNVTFLSQIKKISIHDLNSAALLEIQTSIFALI